MIDYLIHVHLRFMNMKAKLFSSYENNVCQNFLLLDTFHVVLFVGVLRVRRKGSLAT